MVRVNENSREMKGFLCNIKFKTQDKSSYREENEKVTVDRRSFLGAVAVGAGSLGPGMTFAYIAAVDAAELEDWV